MKTTATPDAYTFQSVGLAIVASRIGLVRAYQIRRARRAGLIPLITVTTGGRAPVLLAVACVLAVLLMMAGTAAEVLYAQGVRGVCHAEDSASCVWVPALQGNGHGGPVLVVNGPDHN